MKPPEAFDPAIRLGAINNRVGEFESGCSLVLVQSKGLDEMVEASKEVEGGKVEWREEWGDRGKRDVSVDEVSCFCFPCLCGEGKGGEKGEEG